jgi:hypothetical protein
MSNLVGEILLRLAKAAVAALLATLLFAAVIATGASGGSAELALLCWLSAAAFILLVQESPI